MGTRQKQASEQQSGLWLDSSLYSQHAKPASSQPPVVSTNASPPETIIIPGTPMETKEKLNEFIEKSKSDYMQSWQDLKKLAAKLNKKQEPEKTPVVQPFLTHSPASVPPAAPEVTQPHPEKYPVHPVSITPQTPATHQHQQESSFSVVPSWKRPEEARTLGTRQISPELISKFDTDEEPNYGRIISAIVEEQKPPIITVISSLFFLITFVYTTLTLLSFGLILALAITLNNAGTPGFLYLRYYPNVGLLPIVTCTATVIFMYVAYKIRDASKFGWYAGIISLAVIPIALSFVMPAMSYPLIRLVTIYAGSAKQTLFPPVIDVTMLSRLSSILLFFEGALVLLITSTKLFRFPNQPLAQNARSSIIMMIFLFLVPISTVMSYGFIEAQDTDLGYAIAQSRIAYRLYVPELIPGNRTHSTRFTTDEELAGLYNAVHVTFDVPLPTLMKTGKSSRITLKQVQVGDDFSLDSFLNEGAASVREKTMIPLTTSADGSGTLVKDNSTTALWAVFPENILVMVVSQSASGDELTEFAASLR